MVEPCGVADVAAEACRAGSAIVAAKAVVEKVVQVDLFLSHEAGGRQLVVEVQVKRRAQAGGRGHLDRTPRLVVDRLLIDLPRVAQLDQLSMLPTNDRAEH